MMILAICPYCGSKRTTTGREYAENPYCSGCLQERLDKAVEAIGPVELILRDDGYAEFVPVREFPE